jgi:hypothetical protein
VHVLQQLCYTTRPSAVPHATGQREYQQRRLTNTPHCPVFLQASVTHYTLDRPAIAALLQQATGVAEAGALLAEPAMAADMWVPTAHN